MERERKRERERDLLISESKPNFSPNLGLVDMNRVGSLVIILKCETLSSTVLYCVKVAECGNDGCCRRRERREEENER